jgi:hypothetical protein
MMVHGMSGANILKTQLKNKSHLVKPSCGAAEQAALIIFLYYLRHYYMI